MEEYCRMDERIYCLTLFIAFDGAVKMFTLNDLIGYDKDKAATCKLSGWKSRKQQVVGVMRWLIWLVGYMVDTVDMKSTTVSGKFEICAKHRALIKLVMFPYNNITFLN